MPRMPFPADSPPHVREILENLPMNLGVVKMYAHAADSFPAWFALNRSILYDHTLDPAIVELGICVATHHGSPDYEYAYHRMTAVNAGLSEQQLDALERQDYRASVFSELQAAVLEFSAEVVHQVRAGDRTFAAVRTHLSDRQVIELIMCIGQYMLNSRIAENTGVSIADDRRTAAPPHPDRMPPE